jgi:arylsulfatase A-like enzyme
LSANKQSVEHAWCWQHLKLAVFLGLGLGVLGQLLVFLLARGEHGATLWLGTSAVLYSTAGWMVLSLLLATLSQPLLGRRIGRIAALCLSGTTLAVVALAQVAGVTLRVMSGTYLTTGAVSFSLNSSEHFWHAAVGTYWRWALFLIVVLLGFAALIVRWLSPAAKPPIRAVPPTKILIAGVAVSLLLGLLYARRAEARFTRRMFVSGPLVALVSSLDASADFELARTSNRPAAIGAPLAVPGPPLANGDVWLQAAKAATGPRPNVILLMLESVTPSHMGVHGYERDTTPTLDALAKSGLNMTRAWTTATHSNYAQMAILSSLFPRRGHGLDQYTRLDYPRVLFHDVLHQLGYQTATISSQDENWQGMRRFQSTSTPHFFWFSESFTGEHLDTGTEKIVPDEATTDVVLDWLSRTSFDEPWALYINFQATHFPYLSPAGARRPWQPSEPNASTFNYLRYPEAERDIVVNRYDNTLAYVDDQVERIRRYLELSGELDNTLWIVTSDHGESFFDKGLVTHGKTLYEFESRVPLFFSLPGSIEPEQRDEPVSNMDVMPTLIDLLGLPPHPAFQGRSFLEPDPESVGRHGVYINIQGLRFADGLVCWPYKLILDRTDSQQYLFDLSRDPKEERNLLLDEPEITHRLADTLRLQLLAQLDYHREGSPALSQRYQPRLRPCPELP